MSEEFVVISVADSGHCAACGIEEDPDKLAPMLVMRPDESYERLCAWCHNTLFADAYLMGQARRGFYQN